jgi:adenosylhomocysteine nucleosidase
MLLRWLVTHVVRPAAEQKLRETVADMIRPRRPPESAAEDPHSGPALELPPCQLAFVFGSSVESEALVGQLKRCVTTRCASYVEHAGQLASKHVVVAESGVGRAAAAKATEDLIAVSHPAWVVAAGFAAAIQPQLRRGQIVMADHVLDVHGRQLSMGLKVDPAAAMQGCHVGGLLTIDRLVRTPQEKQELGASYHALACDMETMAVAEACRQAKVRFMAVRVISDALDDRMPPEVEGFFGQKTVAGKLGAATGALFQRPSVVKDLWHLRDEAAKAAERLAKFLLGVAAQLPT